MNRFLILFACTGMLLSLFAMTVGALAQTPNQEAVPPLPDPIQNLVAEGAQIRFLGKDKGFDAWLTIKNGVEQYFYVLPDQSAFVMGVLFDDKGKLLTVRQVNRLRSEGDTLLDSLAEFPVEQNTQKNKAFELKTPAEQLFSDIEDSNWIPFGKPEAPAIYAFMDPQCPHCHEFMLELVESGLIDWGQVQLRMIPVGLQDETRAQAAFLIATPNPQERWLQYLNGDAGALPASSKLNQQGVQRNLAVMQSWKFDATPMIVYKAKNGEVKIIRGKPQNLNALLSDLGNPRPQASAAPAPAAE